MTRLVLGVLAILAASSTRLPADEIGIPWHGAPGTTVTVEEMMRAQAANPTAMGPVREVGPEPTWEPGPKRSNPASPRVGSWPIAAAKPDPLIESPQHIGVSFLATQINEGIGWVPPDTEGDVGPTQFLVHVNGRVKVFDKTGAVGPLNVDSDVFWASVRNGFSAGDPHVRYDPLSGRWFLVALNITTSGGNLHGPNRILIAVSSGSTITGSSSFTLFFFQNDEPPPAGQPNGFADYPTLGIDASALYIGANVFTQDGSGFLGTSGYVVRKSDLIAGTLTVTPFRNIGAVNGTGGGPWTPQGVQNDDPAATEGYFIGVDNAAFGVLDIRRISNPGGVPTLSNNIQVTVPATVQPQLQPALGTPTALDGLDDRLFAAAIHKDKVSGTSTLWTAHNIDVDAGGVANAAGNRNGSRWYQIGNMSTIPTLVQAGTLFDPAATNPRGFWIPALAMSGQGHVAMSTSTASPVNRANAAMAGRLSGDPLGTIQPPTMATNSSTAYNQPITNPQRWGDYAQVGVDPNDDMTLWAVGEYCNSTNSWGVRVVQLLAPPPATPDCATPIPFNGPTGDVTITGISTAGSGFFDPGPAFPKRLAATVSGGTSVNSVSFNGPLSVTLNITVTSLGPKDVTVTNPDGQSVVGTACIDVTSLPVELQSIQVVDVRERQRK